MTFDDLPLFGFDLVVADPPWHFDLYSEQGDDKSPQKHYETMHIEAIKTMRVGDLVGANSWLMLWTSAPALDQGFEVLKAWGFRYVSRFSWRKTTALGKKRMGPGYVVRTLHEDILIGAVGRPRCCGALPSLFDGVAREHSRKPEEFYSMVERFAPDARRLDLFARQSRAGWTTHGHEARKFDDPRLHMVGGGSGEVAPPLGGRKALRNANRRPNAGPDAQRDYRQGPSAEIEGTLAFGVCKANSPAHGEGSEASKAGEARGTAPNDQPILPAPRRPNAAP